jgi:hypothetical protein
LEGTSLRQVGGVERNSAEAIGDHEGNFVEAIGDRGDANGFTPVAIRASKPAASNPIMITKESDLIERKEINSAFKVMIFDLPCMFFHKSSSHSFLEHIQFCPLLSHVHVSRISYTNIALFHVAATIVRYVFRFVFVNGTTIA